MPLDASGKLIEGSIADKTKASIESLKAILEAAGSGIERVVKVRILLGAHGMRICSLSVSVHHIHHFHGKLQGGQWRVWPVLHAQAGTIVRGRQGTTFGRTCRDRSHRFGRLGMM